MCSAESKHADSKLHVTQTETVMNIGFDLVVGAADQSEVQHLFAFHILLMRYELCAYPHMTALLHMNTTRP